MAKKKGSPSSKVKSLFNEIEKVWSAIPGYAKVFLYSTTSSIIGLYATDALDPKSVILIVFVNLGLYQAPRSISKFTNER